MEVSVGRPIKHVLGPRRPGDVACVYAGASCMHCMGLVFTSADPAKAQHALKWKAVLTLQQARARHVAMASPTPGVRRQLALAVYEPVWLRCWPQLSRALRYRPMTKWKECPQAP